MKENENKETDFAAVYRWLKENVLPELMTQCEGPLAAIYVLMTFAKNAALTIGITAGLPPKETLDACRAILDKKDYMEEPLNMIAASMREKVKASGGVRMKDAIDAVDEVAGVMNQKN